MRKILFVNPGPFGSFTHTYHYCHLLRDRYDVTYLGMEDVDAPKDMDGVRLIHVPGGGSAIRKRLRFYLAVWRELRRRQYDFVSINYFVLCSPLRLFSNTKVTLDVRTSRIGVGQKNRALFNALLRFEARMFRHVTVPSAGLREYLRLSTRTHVLPLGGPSFPPYHKSFDRFNILYVGSFYRRHVANTIHAVARLCEEYGSSVSIHYTIVGFGSGDDVRSIHQTIATLGMEHHVSYEGAVRYPEVIRYFASHNIGMSYIPITEYFDNQPPLKTFEYLLSGMPVVATATKENARIIDDSNGVLVNDSVDGVFAGLQQVYQQRRRYDSREIQRAARQYSWESIVDDNLIPYLEGLDAPPPVDQRG